MNGRRAKMLKAVVRHVGVDPEEKCDLEASAETVRHYHQVGIETTDPKTGVVTSEVRIYKSTFRELDKSRSKKLFSTATLAYPFECGRRMYRALKREFKHGFAR